MNRKFRKLSALVASTVMILTYLPIETLENIALEVDAADIIPTEPATRNGIYQIGTAAELYWFTSLVNGTLTDGTTQNTSADAVLTKDIVINEDLLDSLSYDTSGNITNNDDFTAWVPIGYYYDFDDDGSYEDVFYEGIFDGSEHTISGLYFNNSAQSYVGLFGQTDGAEIKNVGVIDSYIGGCEGVGGVCGLNVGCTITNCYNEATVSGEDYVGGVCGITEECTVTGCYNDGTVSGEVCVGGVCAGQSGGNITSCYNEATVSGENYIGGVCGITEECTVTGCYNDGTVSGEYYVGGVCAGQSGGNITNCYHTGVVTALIGVGGICGYNEEGTIANCYSAGTVTASGSSAYAGGVCGYNLSKGFITNCYYNKSIDTGAAVGGNNGTVGSDVLGKHTKQFASGEVAYLLAQGCTVGEGESAVTYSGSVWGQTIGKDKTPVIGGSKVYQYTDCQQGTSYANSEIMSGNHNYVDGKCLVCSDENGMSTHLSGYSLRLGGNIGVNFYVELDAVVIADESAYMLFTLPDDTTSKVYVKDVETDTATTVGTTYYIFSCEVAAKEMYETIKAQIVLSDGETGTVYSFAMEDYANYILDLDNGFDDKTIELVEAMLSYGNYAKAYFNEQELAATDEIEAVTASTLTDYAVTTNGTLPEGIVYYGSTLILESETAIRHYFKVADGTDISAYHMTAKDDFYYVQTDSIVADQLNTAKATTIGDFTILYSAMSYAYAALNSDSASDHLKNLVKALYLYNQAAVAYTLKTGWIQEGEDWYYFNEYGDTQTGWVSDIPGYEGDWFYFNEQGIMQTGWLQLEDNWYYFNNDGTLLRNAYTPDGYYVDENGIWNGQL